MTGLMLWMSGSGVHIFSIMITFYAVYNPVKSAFTVNTAFARFEDAKMGGAEKASLLTSKVRYGYLLIFLAICLHNFIFICEFRCSMPYFRSISRADLGSERFFSNRRVKKMGRKVRQEHLGFTVINSETFSGYGKWRQAQPPEPS